MSKFRRLSASHIVGNRRVVWTCRGCETVYDTKPVDCRECGRLDFVRWDSSAEQKRWAQLRLMEISDVIRDLRRQVTFDLFACGPNSERVRVGRYIADFTYVENGRLIIEDVKGGAITDLSAWKIRHMEAQGKPVKLVKVT